VSLGCTIARTELYFHNLDSSQAIGEFLIYRHGVEGRLVFTSQAERLTTACLKVKVLSKEETDLAQDREREREIHSSASKGGEFDFHDQFEGQGGEPDYPPDT